MRIQTLPVFGVLSAIGMIGLVLAVLFGFEEADGSLLLVAALLMVSGPIALLVHLAFTKELTQGQRRAWLTALTGRHALAAASAYLSSGDRREGLERLQLEAAARRNRAKA